MWKYKLQDVSQHHSIRWRLLTTIFALLVAMVLILTLLQVIAQKNSLQHQQQLLVQLMREKLVEQGRLLIRNVNSDVSNALAAMNFSHARQLIITLVNNNKNLGYAILMGGDRKAYVNTLEPEKEMEFLNTQADYDALSQTKLNQKQYVIKGSDYLEFIMPVQPGNKKWGFIRLGFPLGPLQKQILASEREIVTQITAIVLRAVAMAAIFLLIGSWVAIKIASQITTPLAQLVALVRTISAGDYHNIPKNDKLQTYDEISLLNDAFCEMAYNIKTSHQELAEYSYNLEHRVAERTFELEDAIKNMEKMANTDQLTNTFNRHKFDELFPQIKKLHLAENNPLSLMILDIDHFKAVNDTFGHNVGDDVLIEVAGLIEETIRHDDILFRWGGEEFIVLTLRVDIEGAYVIAEKVRKIIASHYFEKVKKITISLGVAQFNFSENIDDCIGRADKGLYDAKHQGRNCTLMKYDNKTSGETDSL